jgi:hypothetical protein
MKFKTALLQKKAGGTTFTNFGAGSDPKLVFQKLFDEARRYSGEGYSGTIAEKDGFKVRKTTPMTVAEANKFIDQDMDNNEKWGPAFCVPVKAEGKYPDGWLFYGWASE